MSKIPEVYVVSDSLGETAESVAKATISQFDEDIDVVRVPFIQNRSRRSSKRRQSMALLSAIP